jgi:PAS domain S-box-containing protein
MTKKDRVNILLVDDQPGKLLTYEVILQDLGENLIKASSAREAFEHLLKNDVAVVLVDVFMPELDGFELASMIRNHPRFEKTAIIFISATYLSELDRVRGYESGAVDYVPVPVVPEILRAKVKIFIDLYRKTRELELLNAELERRVAERTAALEVSHTSLQESEERLRLASEAAEFGTYDVNVKSEDIHCSPQMKVLLGANVEGDLSVDAFLEYVHPEDRLSIRNCLLAMTGREDGRHRAEYRVQREDGSTSWLLDSGRMFFGEDGGRPSAEPVRVMGTVLDITERKRIEERQLLLMAELDHRVKNILSNISATARLSSKRSASVPEFVQSLDARIQALARAHSVMRRWNWNGVQLHEFANELLKPFFSGQGANIALNGEPIRLLPQVAQSLALVLHELATNAAKYGALSSPNGRVILGWERVQIAEPGWIKLTWIEKDGPPVREPEGEGFGMTVIKAAASDLGAELDYRFDPSGVFLSFRGLIEQTGGADKPELARKAPSAGPASPPAIVAKKRCRVFVLEDEPLIALQVKSELEIAGHQVVGVASNIAQGLVLAKSGGFDCAFLDVRLGEHLSTSIADELLCRGIPFAFGTGYEDAGLLPEHLQGIPRLPKPYQPESISQLLNQLVSGGFEPLAAGGYDGYRSGLAGKTRAKVFARLRGRLNPATSQKI